ncbi:hypothetical protein [Hymenobacter terricola]|uniref:hypothetical protein n=1 Tax=Hymenobacter terricola TaxID=2819236 RepID=UPI001B309453|nr:hypothetical protein [Hymenobacter terricola]
MKTYFCIRLACGLLLLLGSLAGHAQGPSPAALPGYWNLEINRSTRDYTIVRFYDGQDRLVCEDRLPGLCLDLSRCPARRRQRTAARLSLALQAVLRDPARASQTVAGLAQQFDPRGRAPQRYAVR